MSGRVVGFSMKALPWRGNGRLYPGGGRRQAMLPVGRRFSTRSDRSCGGAASISGRLMNPAPDASHSRATDRCANRRRAITSSGRGGIREIEFLAQTHQLIHGGRIGRCGYGGPVRRWMRWRRRGGSAVKMPLLGEAYDGLRVIEHRLQMVADQQTHTLPSRYALDNVARLHGLGDGAALLAHLRHYTDAVAQRFDALLTEGDGPASPSRSTWQRWGRGKPDPELARRIEGWVDGRYQALRSPAAIAAWPVRPALIA